MTREPDSGTWDFLEAALAAELGRDHELARPALEMSIASSGRAAVLAGATPAVVSRLAVGDDITSGRRRARPAHPHRVDNVPLSPRLERENPGPWGRGFRAAG